VVKENKMIETYRKIDKDTLEVTRTYPDDVFEEKRVLINTQLYHLELDKNEIQLQIDKANTKLAILDK